MSEWLHQERHRLPRLPRHGDVPRIDLAFVERTYLYHTPRDTVRALVNGRPGSMQGSGENALRSRERSGHVGDAELEVQKKGARFQGVVSVSTTSRRDGVRLGAKATSSETSSETSFKNSLTVWFAFPAFQNAFVVLDVDGAQVATAVALAAVTSTALATNLLGFGFGGFGARIERHSDSEDTATLLAAIVLGVAGAAVAFVAAPVAGGLAALAAASVTGTPTPWAKSLGAFVLCVVPSSVAAALGTLAATRRLTRLLFESAANEARVVFVREETPSRRRERGRGKKTKKTTRGRAPRARRPRRARRRGVVFSASRVVRVFYKRRRRVPLRRPGVWDFPRRLVRGNRG